VSVDPSNAYLTDAVHRDELPILLVIHEDSGDWQFLDGGYVDEIDAVVVHVEHVFEKHPDLRLLADLPEGWAAERDPVAGEWSRYPWQPHELSSGDIPERWPRRALVSAMPLGASPPAPHLGGRSVLEASGGFIM
jgi:hypothetical protein